MEFRSTLDFGWLASTVLASKKSGRRLVVGIDGPGGSGKSTLAGRLSAAVAGSVIIQVDDFYLPPSQARTRQGTVGALFDLPRLRSQVLTRVQDGDPIRYQKYDWDTESMGEWETIPPGIPIIVEGVYCLAKMLRDAYSFSVFCNCDRSVRLARGLARDGDAAKDLWTKVWMPQEDEYIEKQDPAAFADVVLDSSTTASLPPSSRPTFLIERRSGTAAEERRTRRDAR